MKAVDGGSPPKRSGDGRVIVSINRNLNAPVFQVSGEEEEEEEEEVEVEVTIDETLGTGNQVYKVTATDDDQVDWIRWLEILV